MLRRIVAFAFALYQGRTTGREARRGEETITFDDLVKPTAAAQNAASEPQSGGKGAGPQDAAAGDAGAGAHPASPAEPPK